ncbi:hypothetical protein [Clostridium botulinum]|uniref:hypothetical protein n=1 Tax=Clostridium botulinum TaxID=1491 RepID=UPI001E3E0A43|nr:hypothetical protein [Clostridium botulinum]MCC5424445.1 hypothetical protein [Clostridium botulinum]
MADFKDFRKDFSFNNSTKNIAKAYNCFLYSSYAADEKRGAGLLGSISSTKITMPNNPYAALFAPTAAST